MPVIRRHALIEAAARESHRSAGKENCTAFRRRFAQKKPGMRRDQAGALLSAMDLADSDASSAIVSV
jgi:hypothetical protein